MRDLVLKTVSILAGLCAGCLWCALPALAQLTPQQAAGKQLYLHGTSPSGAPFEAILGDGSTRVPARLMPCASCHGSDGRGRPEGGVVPSDITWDVLTRSLRRNDSRLRPAYSLDSLRRAITDAVDPSGNRLGATMPRHSVAPGDLNNLVEYLKLLGNEPEPGVTADRVRIGAILPAEDPAGKNDNLVSVLQAYVSELNEQDGIYNRKIDLVTFRATGTTAEVARAAREFVQREQVFALLGYLPPPLGQDLAPVLEQLDLPAVLNFAPAAEAGPSDKSQVFYLLSGLVQQTGVLAKFASNHRSDNDGPPAIVYPEHMQPLAGSIMDQCRAMSMGEAIRFQYAAFDATATAASLSRQKVRVVFFLGNGRELQEFLNASGKSGWMPMVLQPGPIAGQEFFNISEQFTDHVFLAFPSLPADIAPGALQEFQFLTRKYKLSPSRPVLALTTLASAKVLLEGLRQAGRHLSRAGLVDGLARLHDFNTGLTPSVTYGPDRRIGALGAYVVKWDARNKTFIPVDPWITP